MIAVAAVVLTYQFSSRLLDRPIASITIEGPFQRVSALQIEEVISDELRHGFLSADLGLLRDLVVGLPWIDDATVARRWPNRLHISVTEQTPGGLNMAYNPKHEWYYYPQMQPDEALVFRLFDTADPDWHMSGHTAIVDPTSRPGAPKRESFEVRTIAIFD